MSQIASEIECNSLIRGSKTYYGYLDALKGIAISIVVIGHVLQFTFGIRTGSAASFMYFNMPLFFYISGYLAYRTLDSFRDCICRILRRGMVLMVPYIVFFTIWLLYTGERMGLNSYISLGSFYWFLYVLFIISTFFVLYEYIIQKVTNPYIYTILWMIPLVLLVIVKIKTGGADYGIQTFTNYYRYYLIGYLCRKYVILYRFLFQNSIVYAVGFVMYVLNWIFFDMHNVGLIFLGTLGAIITLQYMIQQINHNSYISRILIYVGKCSLGIYVMHYFFIPMENFLSISVSNNSPFIYQLTIASLITLPILAVCIFFYKIIEHNRYLYFALFGKLYKK